MKPQRPRGEWGARAMKMSHAGLKSPRLTVLLASPIKSALTAQELQAPRGFLGRFPASVCTSTLTCPELGPPCRGARGLLGKGGNPVSCLLTSAPRPGLWPLQASAAHCSSRAHAVPWVRALARWAICYTGDWEKDSAPRFLRQRASPALTLPPMQHFDCLLPISWKAEKAVQ